MNYLLTSKLLEKIKYSWTDDNTVHKCMECDVPFNLIYRKHHCRSCGKIFCSNCSNYWIDIPIELKKIIKQETLFSNYFKFYSNKERVCSNCYQIIDELNIFLKPLNIFHNINLNIRDYKLIAFSHLH